MDVESTKQMLEHMKGDIDELKMEVNSLNGFVHLLSIVGPSRKSKLRTEGIQQGRKPPSKRTKIVSKQCNEASGARCMIKKASKEAKIQRATTPRPALRRDSKRAQCMMKKTCNEAKMKRATTLRPALRRDSKMTLSGRKIKPKQEPGFDYNYGTLTHQK
jgi:hypothetical protein